MRTRIRLALFMTALVLSAVACSGAPGPIGENPRAAAADPGEKLVFSYPGDYPEWVHKPAAADSEKLRHFTGISRRFSTEVDGRKDAVRNAREQIADYLRTDVKRLVREVSAFVGAGSDIIDPGTVSDEATRMATEATLLGTAAQKYYAEKWERRAGQGVETYWKVYVLVPLRRDAEYDLALGALEQRLKREKDAKKRRNLERAVQRLEELKARGWFDEGKARE